MNAGRAIPSAFALLLLTAAPLATAGDGHPFRLPVEELVLDNGMRVLLAPRPGAALVAAGWAVRRGSGDEPAGSSGVAHLVEHLLHGGSARVSASDFARHYAEGGAVGIDARTDRDLTAYFLLLPRERLELWFWLESDRLLAPALGDVARELRVIAEERRQRLESLPSGPLEEELQRLLWGEHPYALPASGTPEALATLGRAPAEAFVAAHYGAGELSAVLVGDFDAERVRELARRYFGRLPRQRVERVGEGPARAAPGEEEARPRADGSAGDQERPRAATAAALDRTCPCPTQARVLYRTVPASHADRAALDVLAGVLSGRSGRLHRALVVERGLAFAAFARHDAGRRGGAFAVALEARGATPPAALVAAWDEEVARLSASAPSDEELTRVRNQVTTDAWRGLREPLDLALRLLVADAQAGWRTLETWPAAVRAVTPEEVRRVAQRYLAAEGRLVVRVTREAPR